MNVLVERLRAWRNTFSEIKGYPVPAIQVNEINAVVGDAEEPADEIERLKREFASLLLKKNTEIERLTRERHSLSRSHYSSDEELLINNLAARDREIARLRPALERLINATELDIFQSREEVDVEEELDEFSAAHESARKALYEPE